MSSADGLALALMLLQRSLTEIQKTVGPEVDPCGTLGITFLVEKFFP